MEGFRMTITFFLVKPDLLEKDSPTLIRTNLDGKKQIVKKNWQPWNKPFVLGERLNDAECDQVIKDCCPEEDDDGFIPYAGKFKKK